MKNYDGPAHGHKFAKLKPTNHQKFSNSLKLYPSQFTIYTVLIKYNELSRYKLKQISNANTGYTMVTQLANTV